MRFSSAFLVLTCAVFSSAFSCSRDHYIDAPDINIPPPGEVTLNEWQEEFQKGKKWRGDPRRVADKALNVHLKYVPWKYQPYAADRYQFEADHPKWGPHVTCGARNKSGVVTRYRVKLRQYQDIWIAIQVSHYDWSRSEHPALRDDPER